MSELDRLRAARADLWDSPAAEERVVHALDRTLRLWSDPDSEWRARLRGADTLYSDAMVDLGILRGVESWSADQMRRLRAAEVLPDSRAPEITAVWLAGSIPPAMFSAIVLPLLAGSAVRVKAASGDRFSPGLFAESLRTVDPGLADCLAVVHGRDADTGADALVAQGTDATISTLRNAFPRDRHFVGYGHKLSLAAVGADADLDSAAAAVALDAALWDGRGCLSPAWIWVEDPSRARAEGFCAALADAFTRLGRETPRGKLSPAEHAWVHDVRSQITVRDATRLWTSQSGGQGNTRAQVNTDWTVALVPEPDLALPGMLRTVSVSPVPDAERIVTLCGQLSPHLSCIGHCGWGRQSAVLAHALQKGAGSRMCVSGTMQTPPLDWPHDGIPALASLRLPPPDAPVKAARS